MYSPRAILQAQTFRIELGNKWETQPQEIKAGIDTDTMSFRSETTHLLPKQGFDPFSTTSWLSTAFAWQNTEGTTLHEQMEASEDKPIMLDDITPGSPAETAGLREHSDYIIGTPLGIVRGEGDLYELVEEYIGECLPLHVYNAVTNQVREVIIVPSEEWGGDGLLGCDIGYGYLHRLPKDLARFQNEKGSRKEVANDNQGPVLPEKQLVSNPTVTPVGGRRDDTGIEIQVSASPDRIQADKSAHDIQTNTQKSISIVNQETAQIKSTDSQLEANEDPESAPQKSESTSTSQMALDHIVKYQNKDVSSTDVHHTGLLSNSPCMPSMLESNQPPQPYPGETPAHVSLTFSPQSPHQEETGDGTKEHSAEIATSASHTTTQTITGSPLAIGCDSLAQERENAVEHAPQLPEGETRRQPPMAIAARMKPGIHGRGVRVAHDGFPTGGRISLQDAQAQAQQQSAEYRAQMEHHGSADGFKGSSSQGSQGLDTVQGKEGTEARQEPGNADSEVNEYVVEGMIRNMSLGSSIFPL
ncbi:hypothetical protein BGX27_000146 [Mortierella sp. AM989]|nr:hypothetical protein BGX27_000146 [Mortierella sp. AM989]